MKLATICLPGRTAAVRIDADAAVEIGGASVDEFLATPQVQRAGFVEVASRGSGKRHDLAGLSYAPLTLNPSKIICVGVNYRPHIAEMGREVPSHPTLFTKFTEALVGHRQPLIKPAESSLFDFEGELGVVVGKRVRRARGIEGTQAIAGFTVCMDGSVRDWQNHTNQWIAGKAWEGSTPVGPVLIDADSFDRHARLRTYLDGEVMQEGFVDDVVFGPEEIIEYVSTFVTLNPGDLILTGTPGGVGHARKPPVYLREGNVLAVEIDGIGTLENTVSSEQAR